MTQRTYGFEGLTNGSAISTSSTPSGDTAWGAVAANSGTIIADNTHGGASGSMACKFVTVSGVQTVLRWTVTSHTSGTIRLAVWVAALPTVDTQLVWLGSTTSAASCSLHLRTDGSIRVYNSASSQALTTTAGDITTGAWNYIDFHYEVGTSGKVRVAIYRGATTIRDTNDVVANTGTAGVTFVRIGKFATTDTNASTFWVDAIVHDDAASALLGNPGSSNAAPTCSAGADITVEAGQSYTLTGTDNDADGTITSRAWTLSSSTVSTTASVTATAPATLNGTTRTYTYTVTDDDGATASDTVVVTVLPATRRIKLGGVMTPVISRTH